MDTEFLTAFADIVREQMVRKNEIQIKGLGTFKQQHRKQFQQQRTNGQVVMMPPKDIVKFLPDNRQLD